MTARIKRTYNLSPATVHRVRELAEQAGLARSQDAVVDLAVERLYLEIRSQAEAAAWEVAAADPEFTSEMHAVASDYRDTEAWPG